MNTQDFITAVTEVVNNRLHQQNLLPADEKIPEVFVRETLQSIEDLEYKILQDTPIVDNFRAQEANEVIENWLPENITSSADINSAQIFNDLRSRGWHIIAPQ